MMIIIETIKPKAASDHQVRTETASANLRPKAVALLTTICGAWRSHSVSTPPARLAKVRRVETIKKIISRDGKHRLDIEVSPGSMYRYTTFDDRYRNDPDYQAPPEWTIEAFSGLYESVEAVEADAMATLGWFREDHDRE
jgi:hypothetical protein